MRMRACLLLMAVPAFGAITQVQVAGTSSTQAVISYSAPDTNPCTVEISESPTYAPLAPDVDASLFPGANSDSRPGSITAGRMRMVVAGKRTAEIGSDNWRYSRALQAFTTHYFRITCGSDQASGTFLTRNIPMGNTYPEAAPVDAANPGEYAWPYMPWASTSPSMIDPQTGILFKPATKPRSSYMPLGPSPFGNARDIGGLGEWHNPSYALTNNPGQAAVYQGAQRSWLWLQTSNFQTPYGGGGGWSEDGYSVNYFEPTLKIWSTDGQADVCLTADGATCRSVIRTISVPTTEPGSAQTVADTNAPMVYWNDALHIVSKPNMVRRNGYVNVDGSGHVAWSSGDVFNVNWTAGSRLTIANSDCAINSLASDVSLTINLASCPGLAVPVTGAVYASDNFGALVRAHSVGATLSVKAAQWVSEESTDTGWVDGDMTVMCSDTLVADNSVPTQYGYHCTIGGLVWVNPQTGETRRLGDYIHPPGGFTYSGDFYSSGTPCQSDANPFSADGNTEYCLAYINAGPIIMKGVYNGNNQEVGPWPYGQQASPMSWSNLTPISQGKGILDLLHAFDATFDKTLFSNCLVRGLTGDRTKVVGNCFRDAQQDVIGWLWIFDPGQAAVVAAWPTWKAPASRWCRIHAYAQVVASPSWAAVEFSSNGTAENHGGPYAGQGMWTTTITSGSVAQTPAVAPGASIPGFNGLACPMGYAGCDVVTVAGEPCDFDPAPSEPLNCPYNNTATYLQNASVGDMLEFDTGTPGLEEVVQLLGKSGNNWAIVRGYWAQYNYLTESHAVNSKLQEQCGVGLVDTTVWNFVADPHAQDTTATTVIPDKHGFTHGVYVKGVGAGGADWQDCPPNANGSCVAIKKGADVADYAAQTPTTAPLNEPAFAAQRGVDNASLVEIYVAPGPSTPQQEANGDFVMVARPFESDAGLNTVTPVNGQLYKIGVQYNAPQIKALSTLAMCGMHPLADVSGPGSVIGADSTASYTYCIANAGGECQAGSKAGDALVNCPNYSPNQSCRGTEDDRGICVGANAMQVHKISQTSTTTQSTIGAETRPLTSGFHPYRVGAYYWNARSLPDGSWAIVRAPFFNKSRAELFLAKLPPMPAGDSVARNTFVPVNVVLAPPPGLKVNNAIVEFGYAENGSATSFYCTSRNETCIAAAAVVNQTAPFAFPSESPAGVPCSAGCTIPIPAIPQRVVYYRVKYRDASNQVLATGRMQVAVTP